ncbi:MAG: hypothetical protein R6V01_04030 [Thermoplasmatota archaeon]
MEYEKEIPELLGIGISRLQDKTWRTGIVQKNKILLKMMWDYLSNRAGKEHTLCHDMWGDHVENK